MRAIRFDLALGIFVQFMICAAYVKHDVGICSNKGEGDLPFFLFFSIRDFYELVRYKFLLRFKCLITLF